MSGVCAWPRAPWTHPVSIPNLVVPHGSAGEYCAGNCVGGEAAARTPRPSAPRLPGALNVPVVFVAPHTHRGVEQWQLVGLITQRSEVRILPPLPRLKHRRRHQPSAVFWCAFTGATRSARWLPRLRNDNAPRPTPVGGRCVCVLGAATRPPCQLHRRSGELVEVEITDSGEARRPRAPGWFRVLQIVLSAASESRLPRCPERGVDVHVGGADPQVQVSPARFRSE